MIRLNEYLLSKKNVNDMTMLTNPREGDTLDDIVEWIEHIGVDDIRNFKYMDPEPKRNGLICVVCNGDNNDTRWIALYGWPRSVKSEQYACCKPNANSFFIDVNDAKHIMSFDEIIEIMIQMVENPKEIIKPFQKETTKNTK